MGTKFNIRSERILIEKEKEKYSFDFPTKMCYFIGRTRKPLTADKKIVEGVETMGALVQLIALLCGLFFYFRRISWDY